MGLKCICRYIHEYPDPCRNPSARHGGGTNDKQPTDKTVMDIGCMYRLG